MCRHDHWVTKPSVVQTYYDDFYLTSLNVREDHGAEMAIIAEPTTLGNPNYEDRLWHLADTLQSALIGAEAKSDGQRFKVSDIASYLSTWGVSGLTSTATHSTDQLDLAKVVSTYNTDVLSSTFPNASGGATGDLALCWRGDRTHRRLER